MAETLPTTQSAIHDVDDSDDPLLMDFDFPPFASVELRHVRPGIPFFLRQLVWNRDVKFYEVKDSSGNSIAYFYFDPYSRAAEKRGSA